ncbi:MAG: agmatine deiminase family protein, partial [Epsilonproteobacteria bacterium]|nr:agmatine deiminase [Campylobacterota bacterium]NPA57063.1 agmatine deiminase family protein [Campylobacterota bacterium]
MLAAEWFEQEALLITYPHPESDWLPYLAEIEEFFDQFIEIVSFYQEVWLIVPPEFNKSFPNTRLIPLPTNDTWVRDYGPLTLIGRGGKRLLDFTFNGWGLKYPANWDNRVNRSLFGTEKLGFVLEGGAVESNGVDTVMVRSSSLLEPNRNPHLSRREIEEYLLSLFGAKRFLWLESGYLQGDDTDGHIDTLARFVSEDHIVYLISDDPKDPNYHQLRAMEEELRSWEFRLTPLPSPSPLLHNGRPLPASYANFVILNG